MDFSWVMPLLIFMFVLILVIRFMGAMGLDPAALIWAVRSTRKVKSEVGPRDHYDRWIHAHRRSGAENKPAQLKFMRTTGDLDIPEKRHGRVKSIEPWKSYHIVFVSARRWRWSTPYIIPQWMVSDLNRRTMWVKARGFGGNGPIKIPIPVDGFPDIDGHVIKCQDGFRYSFEQQLHVDIMEDMAWDIGEGMSPPKRERIAAAAVEQPQLVEHEVMKEDVATGVR